MDGVTFATATLTVATLGLVVATLLLWQEARRLRVDANVTASVVPWEVAGGLYIAIVVDNAGPAVARDVQVEWRLDRKVDEKSGRLREPAFAVGFRRTILPIRSGARMDDLAAEGASVHAELAWRDGRRRVQHASIQANCEDVRSAYADSGALPRPSLLETLDRIPEQLTELVKVAKK